MEVGLGYRWTSLLRLDRGEKDAGQAKRLRTVILAMEGWTAPAIAMASASRGGCASSGCTGSTPAPYSPELNPIENLWHTF
jgi:transposase